MPATTRVIGGVGCAAAGATTAHHRSACKRAVAAFDLPKLLVVAGRIEQDALIDVAREQRLHPRRVSGRQQVGAQILRTDRVGLLFLVELALVVPADRHREAEADDEPEQRQRGPQDDAEVVAGALLQLVPPPQDGGSDPAPKATAARTKSRIRPTGKSSRISSCGHRSDELLDCVGRGRADHGSNAKIRFQSRFMLITVQPFFFASSYSACVKVPTLLSGRPVAGP